MRDEELKCVAEALADQLGCILKSEYDTILAALDEVRVATRHETNRWFVSVGVLSKASEGRVVFSAFPNYADETAYTTTPTVFVISAEAIAKARVELEPQKKESEE